MNCNAKILVQQMFPLLIVSKCLALAMSSIAITPVSFFFFSLAVYDCKYICLCVAVYAREKSSLLQHAPSTWYNLQIQFDPGLEDRARWERWPTQTDMTWSTVWRWFHIHIRKTERVSGRRTVPRHATAQKGTQNRPKRWSDLASRQAVFQC